MKQQHGRARTGRRWLGTAVVSSAVVGCGGWVDLETPGGAGSGSSSGTAGSAVGGSAGLPPDDEVKGGSGSEPGGSGEGGEPSSEGSSGAGATGPARFVALSAPEPQYWPEGVPRADLTWSGVTSIDAGNLEDGALVGATTYCFKRPLAGTTCDFSTREPFVWTEATGMVALQDLDAINDPRATTFYPSYVSGDGDTVVGSFNGDPSLPRIQGFFRWTREGGAVSLGQPPDTDSGGVFYVSKNGDAVAGVVKRSKAETSQFIWTEAGGFQLLDAALGWPANAEVVAISQDGSTLLAQTTGEQAHLLHLWSLESGAESLGTLPGLANCEFGRVLPDFTAVFGTCYNSPDPGVAFRWTEADGMVALTAAGTGAACQMRTIAIAADGASTLGTANCGGQWHWARWSATTGITLLSEAPNFELTGVSEDASVVFGNLLQGPNSRAFSWDGAPAPMQLPALSSEDSTWVYDSDAEGEVFAGQSGRPNYPGRAVLWAGSSIIDVRAELTRAGVDVQGVSLESAARVASRDGMTVVQGVANSRENSGVWLAWLTAP